MVDKSNRQVMCLKISINSTSFPIIIVKWFSLLSICRASLSEERPIHSLVSFTFVLNYLTSALHSSFFVYSSKKGVWVALRRGVLLSEEEMGQKNSFLLKKKKKNRCPIFGLGILARVFSGRTFSIFSGIGREHPPAPVRFPSEIH